MARTPRKAPPRLALFDRLLQGDSIETDRNADRAMQELRDAVRRDLEMLFNTRAWLRPIPPELEELRQSVLSYGLSEVRSRDISTPAQQAQFKILLETVITCFEPRFRDLSIELTEAQDPLDRTLRLRIHAVLETDSLNEEVTYDTMVDPVSGGLKITNH